MTTSVNFKNLPQYKSRFSLTVERILAFTWNINLVREVKNLHKDVLHYTERLPEILGDYELKDVWYSDDTGLVWRASPDKVENMPNNK